MNFDRIQICDWKSVREHVLSANKRLCKLIDEFDPGAEYDFVKVSYHYGQRIKTGGQINLPISKKETIPLTDERLPKSIRDRLSYSDTPIALILEKSAEVFYENDERVMPTKIFSRGAAFGLWEMFDPPSSDFISQVWNISAGSRTLFMLPKISDQVFHNRLRKHFDISSYQPSRLLEHQQIFHEISAASSTEKPWVCEILFFSKIWSDKSQSENRLLKLHHFWLQEAWRQSLNCRNNMSFDRAWELFSQAVSKRNMRPKPYTINIIKHLLSILEGLYPGYAPAINDDTAPIALLEQAYREIYKLKISDPIIMEPVHLSKKSRPVYYSLQFASLLEYAPGINQGKNIITELREIKTLIDMLEKYNPETCNRFKAFSKDADTNHNIHATKELVTLDKNFRETERFAYNSQFLKGCIQISLLNDRQQPLLSEAVF